MSLTEFFIYSRSRAQRDRDLRICSDLLRDKPALQTKVVDFLKICTQTAFQEIRYSKKIISFEMTTPTVTVGKFRIEFF